MTNETRIWRMTTYLRGQLPAFCAEDVMRKLALTYYLYRKLINTNNECDFDKTTRCVLSFVDNLDKDNASTSKNPLVKKIFSVRKEICELVDNGYKDYRSYTKESDSYDPNQITRIYNDLNDDCLLDLINCSFENSIRDDSTPDTISELVLKLADKYTKNKNIVTDMTCSSGTFLMKAAKTFKRVEGVEINKDNATLAKVRIALMGVDSEIRNSNCFEDSWHHQVIRPKSDLVFAEFPWKLIIKDPDQKEVMLNCNANRFMLTQNSSTDYFFLSAMMNYLNDTGVAMTVVPLSTLSNLSDKIQFFH